MFEKRRKIAIMGGSFNPVHIGHLMLCNYIRQECGFDAVWLVLSPLNPLKQNPEELLSDSVRLEMLSLACGGVDFVEACDVELSMPKPSYTISTLRELAKRYPDTDFCLIIGADNWNIFTKWKCYDEIIRDFGVVVYPRPGYAIDKSENYPNVRFSDAPTFEISSTFVRNLIKNGGDPAFFVPDSVRRFILENNLYK